MSILTNKSFLLRAKTNVIIYPWCRWFFHIFLGKVLFFTVKLDFFLFLCRAWEVWLIEGEKLKFLCWAQAVWLIEGEKLKFLCRTQAVCLIEGEKLQFLCRAQAVWLIEGEKRSFSPEAYLLRRKVCETQRKPFWLANFILHWILY